MRLVTLVNIVLRIVFLPIIFFCVITPIGIAWRLFSRNALDLKADPKAGSYWVPVKKRSHEPVEQCSVVLVGDAVVVYIGSLDLSGGYWSSVA